MHPVPSAPSDKATLKRNILVLLFITLCVIWALVGYDIQKIRNDKIETSAVVSQNLVRSLAAHTETTFDFIRYQLREIRNAYESLGPQQVMSPDVTEKLATSVQAFPTLLSLLVVEANGMTSQAALTDMKGGYTPINPINVSDRTYYRYFADSKTIDHNKLFVGRAIQGRVSGVWFIPVSYPRMKADGTFGGVILGSIGLQTFGDIYQTFDLPPQASVALVRTDGVFLARTPFDRLFFERSFEDNRFFSSIIKNTDHGVFQDPKAIDGQHRILTYQRLSNLPLAVVLTQTYDSIVGGWIEDSLIALVFGALSSFVMMVFAWSLWRQADTVERQHDLLEQAVEKQTHELQLSKEAAVNADQAKSDLLSIVSHELRTPLTSIKGALDLLSNHFLSDLEDDPRKLLDTATKNTDRLVMLVNDILDMEKIVSGKVVLQMENLSLRELVEREIEQNLGYASRFDVQLKLVTGETDATVCGDRFKLGQVLTNLLSNAVKFSEKGGTVTVAISVSSKSARVSVEDHGCGIPEKYQPKIFEKFFQRDAQQRGLYKGTGLGLSISQAIIEQHHGTIGFQSVEDEGTTFYFDLDVVKG